MPSTDCLTSKHRPVELLKLRAETFAFELEQNRQRCLLTGWSMPPEWIGSLEGERHSLLTQIQHEESAISTNYSPSSHESVNATGSLVSSPLMCSPNPRTSYQTENCEQYSTPYSIRKRSLHLAINSPIHTVPTPFRASTSLPPAPRFISSGPLIESDDGSDVESTTVPELDRIQEQFEEYSIKRNNPHRNLPETTTRPLARPIRVRTNIQPSPISVIAEKTENPERHHFEDDYPLFLNSSSTPTIDYSDRRGFPDDHPFDIPTLSPSRSAGTRPKAKESLRHFPLLPTPPHSPRITGAKTPVSEKKIRDLEKIWTVFTENEDEYRSPDHVFFNRRPTITDNYQSDSNKHTPVSLFSPTISRVHMNDPPSLDPMPQMPSGAALVTPSLPQIKSSDGDDFSSAPAYRSSVASKTPETSAVARWLMDICMRLLDVFRDLSEYRKFLSYRGEAAQSLLDFLQTLLDYSQLEERFRTILFVALVRLSRKSELYPRRFALSNVIQEGEHPVTDGHFGEIYKGHFRGRDVCIKVVRMYGTSNHARLYKAFAREAVLWGQLSHANVLPFFGVYLLGIRKRIGLVCPWMENGNVNQFLKKRPEVDRRLLISDVAAGLLYLHENGVIHGDLKGSNILVTGSERACLADFGLASVTDVHGLETASLSSGRPEGGAIRFLAPELIDPNLEWPKSKASDVYAFAFVCYEIFTGNRPFPEVNKDATVMIKVLKGERPARPLDLKYLERGLTSNIWRLIEDCWEHVPQGRPTAFQITERLADRIAAAVHQTHKGGWGDLSPSRYKAWDGYKPPDHYGILVAESLRALEMAGVSLFSQPPYGVVEGYGNTREGGDINRSRKPPSEDERQRLLTLISGLTSVFKNTSAYKRLLSCQGVEAQSLIDTFQMLLDNDGLENQFRTSLVVTMSELSGMTHLYPGCYNLNDVVIGDQPAASGGFADIYRGKFHGESVCLKIIRAHELSYSDYTTERLLREAILWRQLNHPNLLPFYGLCHLSSRLCLVSPWLENGNLSNFLSLNPSASRIFLCSDIAMGVAYLHKNNIVHGDLKGANVLVNNSGRACLADFGLSAVTDSLIQNHSSDSNASSIGGSIRWRAPELNETETIPNTKASDVYAWSCVIYEIFTGRLPFFECTRDVTVIFKAHLGNRPSRPPASSKAWAEWGLTEQIWDLMNDCWERDPAERPVMDSILQRLDLDKRTDPRPANPNTLLLRSARGDVASSTEIVESILYLYPWAGDK